MRPTWAEVSLTALRHNFRTVQQYVSPSATVCAVVKADAYGHGAVECARALEKEGAVWFGVTSVDEGMRLRQGGITSRILILTGFWRGEEEDVVKHDLTPTVWDWNHIELLEDVAEKLKLPAKNAIPVHLKVDTGMSRLGVAVADLPMMAEVLREAHHVVLEGLFTHLASADVIDAPDTNAQILRFEDAITAVIESGLSPVYYHMGNSAAVATRPETWKNMVRPGLSLYGYYLPFASVVSGTPDTSYELPVKPVLTWKTRILQVREVGAGQPLGYHGAYVTRAPARIAVIPAGYADGLNRQLSSRGRVIVRNDYASIVGNVTMDLTLLDITGIPGVDVGDEVILLGTSGHHAITAWDIATLTGTVPYEVLCGISDRVPRKYVE